MKNIPHVLLLFLLVTPWNAWSMAKPTCRFLDPYPRNAVQRVRIETGTTGNIDGISAQEGEAAILSALQRWNQQSESGISFVYDGYASGMSQNYGLIRFVDHCLFSGLNVNGYAEPIFNNKSWMITICNRSSIIESAAPPRHNNLVATPDQAAISGQDIIGTIMHELGHTQGLAHPGPSSGDA